MKANIIDNILEGIITFGMSKTTVLYMYWSNTLISFAAFQKHYNCQKSDKSYSQPTDLKNHMMINSGEKPYHYKQCDKTNSINQLI